MTYDLVVGGTLNPGSFTHSCTMIWKHLPPMSWELPLCLRGQNLLSVGSKFFPLTVAAVREGIHQSWKQLLNVAPIIKEFHLSGRQI